MPHYNTLVGRHSQVYFIYSSSYIVVTITSLRCQLLLSVCVAVWVQAYMHAYASGSALPISVGLVLHHRGSVLSGVANGSISHPDHVVGSRCLRVVWLEEPTSIPGGKLTQEKSVIHRYQLTCAILKHKPAARKLYTACNHLAISECLSSELDTHSAMLIWK